MPSVRKIGPSVSWETDPQEAKAGEGAPNPSRPRRKTNGSYLFGSNGVYTKGAHVRSWHKADQGTALKGSPLSGSKQTSDSFRHL
jgi:hypothetical protein